MLSSFDLDKLSGLLKDFHDMTHIRISIFDDSYHEIISYPAQIAPICGFIRSDPAAAERCHRSDIEACEIAGRRQAPYIYRCYAGLTEAVTPVILGNIVIAYLIFGHLFSYEDPAEGRAEVIRACSAYALDKRELSALVEELPVTDRDYILSASHILQAVAAFLCMDRMVALRQQEKLVMLDNYLNANYTKEITTEALCAELEVGRTTLYHMARQNYGCGIAQQQRRLRMALARKLLKEAPDMRIAEVAEACGYQDYNYFITAFRRECGTSPRRYRSSS